MQIPVGEIPIRHYQRRLIRGLALVLFGPLGTMIVSQVVFPGKVGLGAGIFASLILGLFLATRASMNPPRCPSCGAEAVLSVEAQKQWRHRFPYGWTTECRSCGMKLDRPWDGITRIAHVSG